MSSETWRLAAEVTESYISQLLTRKKATLSIFATGRPEWVPKPYLTLVGSLGVIVTMASIFLALPLAA